MLHRPFRSLLGQLLVGLILANSAHALPNGGQVTAGQASISQRNATSLEVKQPTQKAIINWHGFSIDANELVHFSQPNSSAVVLNRVTGGDPSAILGQLSRGRAPRPARQGAHGTPGSVVPYLVPTDACS